MILSISKKIYTLEKAQSMKGKFDSLELEVIAHFLSNQELAHVASTSSKLRSIFQHLLDERKLLHHVMRGEHDEVRALLTKNIELLCIRSKGIDCSGREFESISSFEYALWALDKHMWDTMLSCIPKNEKGDEVLSQLRSQYRG
jgi:hypothetical protein